MRRCPWFAGLALILLALGLAGPAVASVPKVVIGEEYTNTG